MSGRVKATLAATLTTLVALAGSGCVGPGTVQPIGDAFGPQGFHAPDRRSEAFATMEQGVVTDRGEAGTVSLARISASAFPMTRVPPLMGRYLTDADEAPGAPPVVVLGYDAWQTLLDGDPDPIGRVVELAGTGTVYSYAILHHPQNPAFEYPVLAVLVDLDEGVRVVSNLTDVAKDDVRIGMRVHAHYVPTASGATVPVFRPLGVQ